MSPRLILVAMSLLATAPVHSDDATTNAPPASIADTVKTLLTESSQESAAGDYESAIRDASTAIQLDPKNPSGYELRGSIYIEQKLWDRAERDYQSAFKYSPDVVYKYKLAEIKFLARAYEDARPRFAALESDEHLGDLATYKAFLCDMLGFHDEATLRDLADMDAREHTAAYYFSHAAWCLYHSQRPQAMQYFAAAEKLYDRSTEELYIASLIESRRFQQDKASFVTRDGTPYDHAPVYLESDGLHVTTEKGTVTVPLDQLPDDLSSFPEEMREQIVTRRSILPEAEKPATLVSFTTRSGKSYDNVRWTVLDNGLSVLTDKGWILVPFADLPADHSVLPDALQHQIQQRRLAPPTVIDRIPEVSFTTLDGKIYSGVKAFLASDGLRVLTSEGWITVPFRELPDNAPSFPADWQARIQAGRIKTPLDPSGMAVISFTTKTGKSYQQVRAEIGNSGLRLVTSEGWIEVPYKELPSDLASFPPEWRETISQKQLVTTQDKPPSP